MLILIGVLVFLAAAALDFADARNTRSVADGHAHAAARWSVLMYAIGLVGFFSVMRISIWLVIPECAGLYLGSWLAVRKHSGANTL